MTTQDQQGVQLGASERMSPSAYLAEALRQEQEGDAEALAAERRAIEDAYNAADVLYDDDEEDDSDDDDERGGGDE